MSLVPLKKQKKKKQKQHQFDPNFVPKLFTPRGLYLMPSYHSID